MLLHLWEPWYGWPSLQQVDGGSRDNGGQWQWAIAQTAWSLTRRNITDTLWPFPPFLRACVCKSGAHKAEQPHLWRVIKPQSGERGGEAAAKQESLRLRSLHKPSIPALRGAHHLDHGRGKQRFRCDECARTLTEPHSKEPHSKGPHSMLIRAFARARNRETGPGIVTLCIMKSETFAPGASDKTLGRLNVGGRSTPAAETLDWSWGTIEMETSRNRLSAHCDSPVPTAQYSNSEYESAKHPQASTSASSGNNYSG